MPAVKSSEEVSKRPATPDRQERVETDAASRASQWSRDVQSPRRPTESIKVDRQIVVQIESPPAETVQRLPRIAIEEARRHFSRFGTVDALQEADSRLGVLEVTF